MNSGSKYFLECTKRTRAPEHDIFVPKLDSNGRTVDSRIVEIFSDHSPRKGPWQTTKLVKSTEFKHYHVILQHLIIIGSEALWANIEKFSPFQENRVR